MKRSAESDGCRVNTLHGHKGVASGLRPERAIDYLFVLNGEAESNVGRRRE